MIRVGSLPALSLLWMTVCAVISRVQSLNDHDFLTSKTDKIKIAFGSCFRNYKFKDRYDVFDNILKTHPDVFMWTGDAIYASYPWIFDIPKRFSKEEVKVFFEELKNHPSRYWLLGYLNFKKNTKVIGVWDDHDYGMHDGDTTNPEKDWFKQEYLEFIQEPPGSARWTRPDGAIYTSYYLDSGKKIKLILLDIHYNREGDDDLGKLY